MSEDVSLFLEAVTKHRRTNNIMSARNSSARRAILREESNMQICSICGATPQEQAFDRHQRDEYYNQLIAKWKKRNDPNEPHPGLPLTMEDRVHHTIGFYELNSKDQEPALALMRAMEEMGIDKSELAYDFLKKAIEYRYGNQS